MSNSINDKLFNQLIIYGFISVILIFMFSEKLSFLNTKKFQCFVRQKQTQISCIEAYQKLEDNLSALKYEEADQITKAILLTLSNDKRQLSLNKIENISCKHISKLDYLWFTYSNNKWGFTAQEKIWKNLGGEVNKFDSQKAKEFKDLVKWNDSDEFAYDLSSSSTGHLPRLVFVEGRLKVPFIAERMKQCQKL